MARIKKTRKKFGQKHSQLVDLAFQTTIFLFVLFLSYSVYSSKSTKTFLLLYYFIMTYLPVLVYGQRRIKIPRLVQVIIPVSAMVLFLIKDFFSSEILTLWYFIVHLVVGVLLSLTATMIVYLDSLSVKKVPFSYQAVFISSFACFVYALGAVFEYVLYKFFDFLVIDGLKMSAFVAEFLVVFAISIFASAFYYLYTRNNHINLVGRVLDIFQRDNFLNKKGKKFDIMKMIRRGESEKIEFKSTLRMNLYTKQPDKKIEQSVLKTITAFLNSEGGHLLIGVSDKGRIVGIEKDHFQNHDKFALHFANLINDFVGARHRSSIKTKFIRVKEKDVFLVSCRKSTSPVFLSENGDEKFYIRSGPASIELKGYQLLESIRERFEKKQG